jgi:penicillin-binding protein-related factor A (putative recombinase)
MVTKDKEKALWAWLRDGAKPVRRDLHMHRVENEVEVGCPDVEGCYRGSCFWTELKSCPEPGPRGGVQVKITDRQMDWLRRRRKVGGLAWLLIRVGTGNKRRHYLLEGEDLTALRKSVQEVWLAERSVIGEKDGAASIIRAMAGF